MKKSTINKITLFTALGLGVILMASCTANFCTNVDKANIMYAYDTGTSKLLTTEEFNNLTEEEKSSHLHTKFNDHVYLVQYYSDDTSKYQTDYNGDPAKTVTDVVSSAKSAGITIPSKEYWFAIDKKTIDFAVTLYENDTTVTTHIAKDDLTVSDLITPKNEKLRIMDNYGPVKFADTDLTKKDQTLFKRWDEWTEELRQSTEPGLGIQGCPSADFTKLYKNVLNTKVNNVRSCIAISTGEFGNFGYNHRKVNIQQTTWGEAFKHGPIEGLLVFPVAYTVEWFCHAFGMDNVNNGWPQLGAILLVTFIVRTILLLVSLKSTIGQQKMTMLQPEINKIQAKYPNANTNAAQKQRMSQETMALYKKNKINPLGTLLVLIVQFPLFIGVWGAMQGSAALASDAVLNLHLSDSIWNTLMNTSGLPSNTNGWWTAFGLFILMAVAQFVAMKLPQWMQKYHDRKHPQVKLSANPAQNKTQRQMKWFGYIMLVMIIIMGFTLPAGMGVYWLAGALFSIVQTVVLQFAMNGTFKRFGLWVKKIWLSMINKFKGKGENN